MTEINLVYLFEFLPIIKYLNVCICTIELKYGLGTSVIQQKSPINDRVEDSNH